MQFSDIHTVSNYLGQHQRFSVDLFVEMARCATNVGQHLVNTATAASVVATHTRWNVLHIHFVTHWQTFTALVNNAKIVTCSTYQFTTWFHTYSTDAVFSPVLFRHFVFIWNRFFFCFVEFFLLAICVYFWLFSHATSTVAEKCQPAPNDMAWCH